MSVKIKPANLLALSIDDSSSADPGLEVHSGHYEEDDPIDLTNPSEYWRD